MIHPHQLHSLGKLYHEEALQEARVRRLTHRTKAHRRPRSRLRHVGIALRGALLGLKG
jgi:hypothetical protein